MTLCKVCADHLRNHVRSNFGQQLKASHACEIVAAFFGYKSHASHLADSIYPTSNVEEAAVMVPDVARINWRLTRLKGLPSNLPSGYEMARILTDFLVDEGWFGGEVWLYETVEGYITDVYLVENDSRLLDDLSGVMAETNAYFDEANFDEVTIDRHNDGMSITVTGTYSGANHEDRVFSGDTIDMSIMVTLDRAAGYTCFHEPDFSADGSVNDDWYDPGPEFEASPAM